MKCHDWTTDLRSLGKGASRDIQDVIDLAARRGGWVGRKTAKGHIALRHRGGGSAILPATPSDKRSAKNARRQIERGGLR